MSDVDWDAYEKGEELDQLRDEKYELKEALKAMVYQFGYWTDGVGGLHTGGLSALELAFEVLGWDDPHPVPEMRCDEPGCMKQNTVGWPSTPKYRRTCIDHWKRGES